MLVAPPPAEPAHTKSSMLPRLHAAAESGDAAGIAACLAEGAPPDGVLEGDRRRTPLCKACGGGHAACAALLLGAGADPNAVCEPELPLKTGGGRPLHAAAYHGDAGGRLGHATRLAVWWLECQQHRLQPCPAARSASGPPLRRTTALQPVSQRCWLREPTQLPSMPRCGPHSFMRRSSAGRRPCACCCGRPLRQGPIRSEGSQR